MYRHALVILIVLAMQLGAVAQAAPCLLSLGERAPQLAGPDLSGGKRQLSDYQGKWVFIDFWASWCSPCMRELPNVVSLHNELSSRPDFTVLSVSLDDESTYPALTKVTSRYSIDYPVIYDGSGWMNSNARDWCVDAIPATFLVDPQGNVVARDISPEQAKRYIETAPPIARQAILQPPRPMIQMQAVQQLLDDSPSTGRSGMRDFELELRLPPGTPFVSQYQLYLRYSLAGQRAPLDLRYDIAIALDPPAVSFPYTVDISESSGNNAAYAAGKTLPAPLVGVDPQQLSCEFTIPLPRECSKLAYTIAFYDEASDAYYRSSVSEISLTN
jgi:peroxiredoxin